MPIMSTRPPKSSRVQNIELIPEGGVLVRQQRGELRVDDVSFGHHLCAIPHVGCDSTAHAAALRRWQEEAPPQTLPRPACPRRKHHRSAHGTRPAGRRSPSARRPIAECWQRASVGHDHGTLLSRVRRRRKRSLSERHDELEMASMDDRDNDFDNDGIIDPQLRLPQRAVRQRWKGNAPLCTSAVDVHVAYCPQVP